MLIDEQGADLEEILTPGEARERLEAGHQVSGDTRDNNN